MRGKSKRIDHSGSSFDQFLREEGVLEKAEAVAIRRVIAWQLRRQMQSGASVKEDDQNAGTAS
jgi:antitoxin HicB